VQIFNGPLNNPGFRTIRSWAKTYQDKLTHVECSLSHLASGNARESDITVLVLYDQTYRVAVCDVLMGRPQNTGINYYDIKVGPISDLYPDPALLKPDSLHVYLAYAQIPAEDTDEQGMVSITMYNPVTIDGLSDRNRANTDASTVEVEVLEEKAVSKSDTADK